jgi:hypothetical protein
LINPRSVFSGAKPFRISKPATVPPASDRRTFLVYNARKIASSGGMMLRYEVSMG